MLPSELLIARVFQGRIRPVYAEPAPDLVSLADSMIKIYGESVGLKHSVISEKIQALERMPFDYRLIRGLQVLLDRRSTFVADSPVEPHNLRREIFTASGGVTSQAPERDSIVKCVADRFGISQEQVEAAFWGDLEGEKVLKGFSPPSALELLSLYNLSMTQTLAFRATSLEFSTDRNWKQIFRKIKRLGLMYSIAQSGRLTVSVDGPASLIKMTERYGTNLALLIPEITSGSSWRMRSQIVSRWHGSRKLLSFELSSDNGILLPASGEEDVSYDSSVEEDFAVKFTALNTRWSLLREPEPLPVGSSVMIPDFAFELGETRIFLEIVGFWTPEYLERKLKKLKQLENRQMIIAVDSSLGISGKIPGEVIVFEKEIPLKPILDVLERTEGANLRQEVDRLIHIDIKADSDVVDLEDLALEYGVSKEALIKRLQKSVPNGYTLVGGHLIRYRKLEAFGKILSRERSLVALIPKLEAEGISDPYPLIDYFGYRIKWRGLTPDSAEILR